ncbi:MAG: PD-(D/E)XK nuclease family protein, partial [Elusimicrobia bacterium]|nr:PD-(D/E)XK nuclease family protein [Elusimicrobiota bacterium]
PARGRLPGPWVDAAWHDEAMASAAAVGSWSPAAGAWDGVIGRRAELEAFVTDRGLSPSALDALAACPFRFFAERILGLAQPEPAARRGEFPPAARGRLYHEILERFHRGCSAEADWTARLDACLEAVFSERGWGALGLYPLLWEAIRSSMSRTLREFLDWDMADIRRSGLRPALLEARLDGRVAAPRPKELAGLRLHGFADRIDRSDDGCWRVVDYKTRWGRGAGLRRLALAGRLHQLPVYAELAACLPGHERLEEACIYALEESPQGTGRERVCRYAAAELAADREAFWEVVAAEVGLVRSGCFPIVPEDGEFGNCGRCAYPALCRKSHGPSRARASEILSRETKCRANPY